MKINIIGTTIVRLYQLLNKRQRVYLFILLSLTILLSLIETMGVSIVMPFISVASNPSLVDSGNYHKLFVLSGVKDKYQFIIFFGIFIIIFYFFRSIYNILYTYFSTKYSRYAFKTITYNLFNTYLRMPYKAYIQGNSSDYIHITNGEANNTSSLILHIIQMFAELFTVVLLYSYLIIVNWQMTLILTLILLFIVLFILRLFVKKTKVYGIKKVEAHKKLHRTLEETFGNIKFVKLRGNEKQVSSFFNASTNIYARAETVSETIGILPKNILENAGFTLLIATVIFILWKYNSADTIIPIITMYALALYRILPAMFKILQKINQIIYYQHSLDLVYTNTNQEIEHDGDGTIDFNESIQIKNISFSYLTGPTILNNISLTIKKGEKAAITGESGSGKSTLIDIITGIHRPDSGSICIDDIPITSDNIRSWRSKIGYIPQNIYLFDGTVAENVSFGSDYNEDQIIKVLKMANIWDFLSEKDGLLTNVGDGGVQLSGGQKQRIGIARALYNEPDILVLDEATSALDTDTEAKIMDEIYNISNNKTLIIIAHRLSTVERCDRKISLKNGSMI
ncbi:protein glycosylation K [Spirochaetia bacterium]|nr:protein glycosylation K [Spirochaetia bacterium]